MPEVYGRAAWLLEPADYVVAQLTGRCVTNPCTGFAQLLIDNRDLGEPAYDDELIGLSGLDRELLPEIVATGTPVGSLTAKAAAEIGLEPTTRVFTGVNDTQAVSVGTGAHTDGRAGINVGTTCQVLGFLDQLKVDPGNNLFAMPSPLDGRYNVMAENGLGARLVQHFLEDIVFAKDALSAHSPADPYAGVAAALASEPPGAGGVLYLPWLNGSNTPSVNSSMRGGFLNLSLDSNRSAMLRAIVEGITFNLMWQLGHMETLVGGAARELRFAGGGAQYDAWAQTLADISKRPVLQMDDPRHINNRATAFLAFVEMGVLSLEDSERFFPVRRRYQPAPEHRSLYDDRFAQYQAAFEQVRPICEALNRGS